MGNSSPSSPVPLGRIGADVVGQGEKVGQQLELLEEGARLVGGGA